MSARQVDCPQCGPCIQDDADSICCPSCGNYIPPEHARAEGPAPVSAPLDREGVARIIDPRAFKPTIFSGDPDWHPGDDNLRRINALTKADAILALSQQDQVGGPTESDPS